MSCMEVDMSTRRTFARRLDRTTVPYAIDLPPEAIATFRAITRNTIESLMRNARHSESTESLIDETTGLLLASDVLIRNALDAHAGRFPIPKCKPGCSHCCILRVSTLPSEIFVVAEYIAAKKDCEKVTERIAAAVDSTRGLSTSQYFRTRTPCPLLENGVCGIYPVRPFACRGYFSLSPRSCFEALKAADPWFLVPLYIPGSILTGCIQVGMIEVFKRMRVQKDLVNLLPALLLALKEPETAARWARGERVFEKARVDKEAPKKTTTYEWAVKRSNG